MADSASARDQVLRALQLASDVEVVDPGSYERYVLIAKVDDDALSDRRATFHASSEAARIAITALPAGWWPDCLIDLGAPLEVAVRDAAVGDGSLGDPYPFDADHVVFA